MVDVHLTGVQRDGSRLFVSFGIPYLAGSIPVLEC